MIHNSDSPLDGAYSSGDTEGNPFPICPECKCPSLGANGCYRWQCNTPEMKKDTLLRELVASLEGLAEDTKPTGPMADVAVRIVLLDILRRAQAAMKETK